jgi:hypothetical protein
VHRDMQTTQIIDTLSDLSIDLATGMRLRLR